MTFLRSPRSVLLLFLFALVAANASYAQTDPSAGIPMFSTQLGGSLDLIDPSTSNIFISLPLRAKTGRPPVSFSLISNSHAFAYTSGTKSYWGVNTNFLMQDFVVALSYASTQTTCNGAPDYIFSNFGVVDGTGANHPLPSSIVVDLKGCNATKATGMTTDGSGYTAVIDTSLSGTIGSVYDRSGSRYSHASSGSTASDTLTDPDGNQLSKIAAPSGTQYVITYKDTLGTTVLTRSAPLSGVSSVSYSYTDANGNAQIFQLNYSQYTQQTNFTCAGVVNIAAHTVNLPSSLTIPSGGAISFTYEATGTSGAVTGRIAKITFPSGAAIAYSYSGGSNGVNCSDYKTVPTLVRTLLDSSGTLISKWTYANSGIVNNANTVTVTDPANNQIVYSFAGGVQTQKTVYQGAALPQNILSKQVTCYNGQISACPASTPPTSPIAQVDVYEYPSGGISAGASDVRTLFNSAGLITGVQQYDFGQTVPTTTLSTSYDASSSCGSLVAYIYDKPCSVNVTDSTGLASQTSYTYNSTGHPLSTSRWISGTGAMTSSWSSSALFNGNGTIQTFTDNSRTTTYHYDGVGGCNNLLITSVGYPAGLSTSQTWDCNGAVKTSVTDANSQTTAFGYKDLNDFGTVSDPYWRMTSAKDPLGNITNYYYAPFVTGTTDPYVKSILLFNNGTTAANHVSYFDSLGRLSQSQIQQAPGGTSFDTVSLTYGYDATGVLTSVSLPCSSGANTNCSTAQTTQTHDALGRPLVGSDGGGRTVTYKYIGRDVIRTDGPGPLSQRQYEYDGLGRLKSVCEISSQPGNGPCGQDTAQNGFLTTYTYNALGEITGVNQDAQPGGTTQVRTFQYDGLGRRTQEKTPESGSVNYFYDSDATCNSISAGDMVKRVDAAGNTTCYYYDQLHRLTDAGFAGPVCRRFRYDSSQGVLGSIPAGISVANTMGKIVEAETDTCSSPVTSNTVITDEWFSYSARGELTDVYQSTPHSGGYYHSVAQYYPHGGLQTLSPGVGGHQLTLPWSYGVDGEGRMILDNNTTYNAASQLAKIVSNTGDNDNYQYDPQTGRMQTYQSNIGSVPKSVTGVLQWNPNGTLQSLSITDALSAIGTENCNYGYDDLARIASVGCKDSNGTNVWNQNFSYDAFGNVTKTVPSGGTGITWAPGYDSNSNHYATSSGARYDPNGNLLSDTFSTYTWDPNWGNVASITPSSTGKTTTITYDALGREVEFGITAYTQVMYGPTGKVATMQGQTEVKAFQPLPGGGVLVHRPGSLTNYWRHPDWLGSSRLATTTPGRTLFFDTAYAPFGEDYLGSGTTDLVFTGQNQDTITASGGLYDFVYREYAARQGRWISSDPAGMAAADPRDPQSWNRYAYVGNSPCWHSDPLGLDKCTFNVRLINSANISAAGISEVEQRIQNLFAATTSPNGDSVGVNFSSSGKPDSTVTVYGDASWFTNKVFDRPGGAQGGAYGDPRVYWNNAARYNPYDPAELVGAYSVHELAHAFLGGDEKYDPRKPNTLMFDNAPDIIQLGAYAHPDSPLWKFSPDQIGNLFKLCKRLAGYRQPQREKAWFNLLNLYDEFSILETPINLPEGNY